MLINKIKSLKIFGICASLIFISNCDNAGGGLSEISPVISLEIINDLSNTYLGEEIDNLELILKVKDAPSISGIFSTVSYDGDNFEGKSIAIQTLPNQFFNNSNANANIIDCACPIEDGRFTISTGLHNNQETIHANGNGEIARLYLSGKNIQTDFDISIDLIDSYDFEEYRNIDDWTVENLSVGPPIPELYFDNFSLSSAGVLSMGLSVSNLPKATKSEITITYNPSVMSFIDYDSPIKGDLTNSNFELLHSASQGEITFEFNGDGNYTEGDGSLVFLEFNIISSVGQLDFTASFNEAIYDVCGDCDAPLNIEYHEYDEEDYYLLINRQDLQSQMFL